MNELQAIRETVDSILLEMENQNYLSVSIKTHSNIYNLLLKYIATNVITSISEAVCLEFLSFRTGHKMPGLYGKGNQKLKPLQVLLEYINTGTVTYKMRSKVHSYICSSKFEEEYIAFQDIFEERRYAKSTIICINQLLQKFLLFLDQSSIHSSKEICIQPITEFISKYKDRKPKYISTIISTLRNYLSFLYTEGFIINDVSKSLPDVRIMRNTFIPYSWKTEDVKKLLQAVDRCDPKGKRDYAILLLVVRLGLRVSDIRSLKLSSLNWNRKMISLTMQKTKQPLELQLLDDIGWTIIDYLKNGRPQTKCDRVFVRHRAPFDSFGEDESFYRELHRYMVVAKLDIPLDVH